MRPKIKLLAIAKDEHRSQYVFPKQQKLFGVIRESLIRLGFEKNKSLFGVSGFGRPVDEETEAPILDEENDIQEYNETIQNFSNEKYSVDIIFFSQKVVLIFNYKKDRQQEISKAIEEFIENEN